MKKVWQNLNHFFLIFITLAFTGGILLHYYFPVSDVFPTLLAALLLIPAWLSIKKGLTGLSSVLLLLLAFSLGILHTTNYTSHSRRPTTIRSRIGTETDVVLSGTLHSMPLFDGEKTTILIRSRSLRTKTQQLFAPVSGLVQLSLREQWPPDFLPGDELIIRCTLAKPYRFGNPGSFDYPAFLARKNIHIVGRISSSAHIHTLQYEKYPLQKLRAIPEQFRVKIRDFIDKSFPSERAGIYRAILIGDRSGISKERLETFKAAGVMHIFAISGLHLSIVASTLFFFFYWLTRRSSFLLLHASCKKLALLATIPPLCAYALLAGAQTPVVRSLIMVMVFILSFCVQRQRSAFTTLSFAALLILLFNPLSLYTASFQLSFTAVAALILILPVLTQLTDSREEDTSLPVKIMSTCFHWVLAALLISIAATIGTAPLLIHFFNRFSTVGALVNLLLEPLLCLWSLPFGLMAIPFMFFAPDTAEILLGIGGTGITAALSISDFFSALSFSTLWFATPSIPLILCYYVCLAFLFTSISKKITIPLFLLLSLLFLFPPRTFFHTFCTESELVFLDVGQGSSTLILLPGGMKILIDGGGTSSKKFNVGESVIAPYLWHRGFTRLDAILITHPDADHYNGIPFLLKRFQPETLWVNGDTGHDQRYIDLLNLADKFGIPITIARGNKQLTPRVATVTLDIIHNPLQDIDGSSSNDKSIILEFSDNGFSCILPGDISRKVEQQLLQNKTLQTDILLSPHHGSKTSSSYSFLDQLNPKHIIVSAGRFQPAIFPSKALQDYCRKQQIPLLNTAVHGAITITVKDGKYDIYPYRPIRACARGTINGR